jgi:hypothetical protein
MGLNNKLEQLAAEDEERIAAQQEEFRQYVEWRQEQMSKGGVPEDKRPI